MSVEYIGAKIFLEEIRTSGEVWVAKSTYGSIYAMDLDRTGFSLPLWSSQHRVEDFLKRAHLTGPHYLPHALSLQTFVEAWLSDKSKAIVELQINPPSHAGQVLVMTTEEFRAEFL